MILYLLGIRYIDSWHGIINNDMIVVAIGGKIIYLIGVKFLKRFTNEKSAYETETQMVIMTVPVLTIICLTMLMVLCQDNGHIKPLFFSKISKMHKLVAFIPRFA